MKNAIRALPLSAILAAGVNAQATTVVNNPADPGAVTSYYSICPTGTSSTITLSTTVTLCPGPGCAGVTTIYTQLPPVTTVGPNGQTTVFEEMLYTAPCSCAGGVCDAVYTITQPCPCNGQLPAPTAIPPGFTANAMPCSECAMNGGPSTVTVVTPLASGPWASQTPVMGTPYNGATASAGSYAYASAGPNGAVAGSGASAVAAAGNGYAAANAGSSASAWSYNSTSGASSESEANAEAGNNVIAPVPSVPVPTVATSSPIAPWKGAANRAVYAFSAAAAGVIGCLALML